MNGKREEDGRAGIDAGATLWKLARFFRRGEELELAAVPAGAVEAVRDRLAGWRPTQVHLTGGGAARLAAALAEPGTSAAVREVSEFVAWARGAPLLAARAGWVLPERYLLVSLGTGTSILEVTQGVATRVSGLTLGGGALLGLGRLLCRTDSFAEVAALAERGDRSRVDLTVGDVYPEGGIALDPRLTAASFAKVASEDPADLAQALVGLLGENVGISCAALARAMGLETLVVGGSAVSASPLLGEILRLAARVGGADAWLLPDGAFCGAVGAAALADVADVADGADIADGPGEPF
jgi:type II pantothenate kinase